MTKNMKLVELNISIATDFLNIQTDFKDDLIEYKYLCCNKNHQHKFDENLKDWFFNTYKFSGHDNNKVVTI